MRRNSYFLSTTNNEFKRFHFSQYLRLQRDMAHYKALDVSFQMNH